MTYRKVLAATMMFIVGTALFLGAATTDRTFDQNDVSVRGLKDDPNDSSETPAFGKRNSTTGREEVVVPEGVEDPGSTGVPVDGSNWTATHVPAANTQATVTRSSPGATKRIVVQGFNVAYATSAATAGVKTWEILCGATQKYVGILAVPAIAGSSQVSIGQMTILCALDESVTIRFTAAGGANTFETVAMYGYEALG